MDCGASRVRGYDLRLRDRNPSSVPLRGAPSPTGREFAVNRRVWPESAHTQTQSPAKHKLAIPALGRRAEGGRQTRLYWTSGTPSCAPCPCPSVRIGAAFLRGGETGALSDETVLNSLFAAIAVSALRLGRLGALRQNLFWLELARIGRNRLADYRPSKSRHGLLSFPSRALNF